MFILDPLSRPPKTAKRNGMTRRPNAGRPQLTLDQVPQCKDPLAHRQNEPVLASYLLVSWSLNAANGTTEQA